MTGSLAIEIDVQSVKTLLDEQSLPLLLDCREHDEYDLVRIEGSLHIPMNDIPSRLSEMEAYRDQRMVVHCHLGGRSFQVVQWLRSQGFELAQNMTGGIDAWAVHVDPKLPRY